MGCIASSEASTVVSRVRQRNSLVPLQPREPVHPTSAWLANDDPFELFVATDDDLLLSSSSASQRQPPADPPPPYSESVEEGHTSLSSTHHSISFSRQMHHNEEDILSQSIRSAFSLPLDIREQIALELLQETTTGPGQIEQSQHTRHLSDRPTAPVVSQRLSLPSSIEGITPTQGLTRRPNSHLPPIEHRLSPPPPLRRQRRRHRRTRPSQRHSRSTTSTISTTGTSDHNVSSPPQCNSINNTNENENQSSSVVNSNLPIPNSSSNTNDNSTSMLPTDNIMNHSTDLHTQPVVDNSITNTCDDVQVSNSVDHSTDTVDHFTSRVPTTDQSNSAPSNSTVPDPQSTAYESDNAQVSSDHSTSDIQTVWDRSRSTSLTTSDISTPLPIITNSILLSQDNNNTEHHHDNKVHSSEFNQTTVTGSSNTKPSTTVEVYW